MNTDRTRRRPFAFRLVVMAGVSAIALAATATVLLASGARSHPTNVNPILPDHLASGNADEVSGASKLPDHLAYEGREVAAESAWPDHLAQRDRDVAESAWPDHLMGEDGRSLAGAAAWPDHLVSSPRNVARVGR